MKKPMPIEALLRWCYRDELPKAQGSGRRFLRPDTWSQPWGAITKTGLLGTEVQENDVRNKYGLVPDMTSQAEPHPDAIRLWQVVQDLDGLDFDLPEDWNPIEDFDDLGVDGEDAIQTGIGRLTFVDPSGKRQLRENYWSSYLLRFHAIMGAPTWNSPRPKQKTERLADGRIRWFIKDTIQTGEGSFEIEVDGYDYSKRLPKLGAYKRTYFDPDPAEVVVARGAYEIWHAALCFSAEKVASLLDDHLVLPTEYPARPWESGGLPHRRILADLRPRQPYVGGEPPVRAGSPLKRSEHGEVKIIDIAEYERTKAAS